MAARRPPSVVLWSAPGTLERIDTRLRRAGVRLVRLTSLETRPRNPHLWLARLSRGPAPEILVVSSPAAVQHGVVPWRQSMARWPRGIEAWAAGPETALALRRAGVRRPHQPGRLGASALARTLSVRSPRTIAYLRSDRAGTALARYLRKSGHRVVDVVVYRVGPPRAAPTRTRRELARANLLVVTSPSGFSELVRQLDRRTLDLVRTTTPIVVLGERSARFARRLGFRRVSLAPSVSPYRFSRHLLQELGHAPS